MTRRAGRGRRFAFGASLVVGSAALVVGCGRPTRATPDDLRRAASVTAVRTIPGDAGAPGPATAITTTDPRQIVAIVDALGALPTMEVRCTEESPPLWAIRFDFPPPRGGTPRASVWASAGELGAASPRVIVRDGSCYQGKPGDPARLEAALFALGFAHGRI